MKKTLFKLLHILKIFSINLWVKQKVLKINFILNNFIFISKFKYVKFKFIKGKKGKAIGGLSIVSKPRKDRKPNAKFSTSLNLKKAWY